MKATKTDIVDLDLRHLPQYAGYLLDHRVEQFVRTLLRNSYDADVPLLRMLPDMTEDQLFDFALVSNKNMLECIRKNDIPKYIETTRTNWINNQLTIIAKDQIIADDIVLVNYARKKTFRAFIGDYSSDLMKALELVEEVDRFVSSLDAALFKTFIGIQEQQIREINESLKKRENQLLDAQAIAQIGSFEWDFKGQNSSYTPEVYKIFEFDKTNTLEAFLEDVHPEDRLKIRAALEKAMHDGEYQCEYRYNRNNKPKVLFSRGKVYFDKNVPVKMIGTVMDITEKSNFILKLQESEELSKQSQVLTSTGTWKWTLNDNQISWSDEMYRIYGLLPQSEVITFDRFVSFIHPDYKQRRLTEITEALQKGIANDYIMKIICSDGKEKFLKGKGKVLLDGNRNPVGMLGTCQDITKEYALNEELETRNQELSRKNKVLESFNFIATHDLQEPLRKIQVYSNRMLHEGVHDIPEKYLKYFDKISISSNRMQRMIEDFMTFYQSLNAEHNLEEVDLKVMLNDIKEEFSDAIAVKNAKITSDDLPCVQAIRIQIRQLLKQLISNALKFSKPNVKPEISIVHALEKHKDGRCSLKLIIKDNGIGFDSKYAERIFDLFQKLHSKDEYSGSGIGLSLCKKIVEAHGGNITAQSEPGIGSEFCVCLPLRDCLKNHPAA